MFHSKSDDDVPVVAAAVVASDPVVVAADSSGFQMGKTYYACVPQFPEPFEAVLLWYDPTKGFKIKPIGHDETGIVETLYHSKDAAQAALLAMKQVNPSTTATATAATTATLTTAHDNQALELVISRLENAAMFIESNRDAEISALKRSLEEAREKFEKARRSLRNEISDQKKELDELRGWDTVNITWKISTFHRNVSSSTFNAAQYTMCMNMEKVGDERYGYLGFYITHKTGYGYDRLPIQIAGSSVSVVGKSFKDTKTMKLGADAVIEKAGLGCGWKEDSQEGFGQVCCRWEVDSPG